MKYIAKEQEPKEFTDWKRQESPEKWRDFQNPVKSLVRDSLTEEQGCICCYCGTRIQKDHNTVIEHLKPRRDYPENMFNYDNLLASCHGSAKDIIHIKNDTLENIVRLYGVRQEEVRSLNPDIDFNHSSSPSRIRISKKADRRPEDLHCDTRKGRNEIPITPLMPDCEDFFQYRRSDGEMISNSSEEAEETIRILGLNAKICKTSRKGVLNGVIHAIEFIHSELLSAKKLTKENFRFEIEQLIKRYSQKNEQGQFGHYCFVCVSYLRDFLEDN
ncbi:MAG: TIGR02646 family protein [Deltaproteobacteria bacterium]|nr:MAG: TIGR02646 family protein [Deltaproteobacteria bacterium]